MSQAQVERLRRAYDAFNVTKRVDIEGMAPDVVVIAPDDMLGEGVIRGRDAYVRNVREFTDTFDDFRAEPEQFFDLGDDRVLVFVRFRGRAHESGVPIEFALAHLHTFRGDQVAQLQVYTDRREALDAVGLGRKDTEASPP
jgi:ketosteroid isomerase-like protein